MNVKSMRRNRRKQKISLITNIIFSLITLSALTGCIILLLQNYSLRNRSQEAMSRIEEFESIREEFKYSQADLDSYIQEAAAAGSTAGKEEVLGELKQRILGGESTVAVFRSLFPEDVVVYADGGYHFFPISDSLKKHNYVYDNFVMQDDGEVVYMDDTQEIHSAKGIDVSRHQGEIDWDRVGGNDISYAFIRAGYRGSSEGKLVEDEYFEDNIKGALDNDIAVGIYFYTQAVTEKEAEEEAEFVLDLIEDYDISYPVVLDLEETGSDTARTAEMTKEEYTKAAVAFCKTIQSAGYTPMIYGNLKTFMIMLDMEQIEEYDKWFAYYDTPVYFPYDFAIWQYSSRGSVGGVNGDVDLNVCMKDYLK
ncbi:MAG: glycoside hydrolase [Lachnospiraceae bacterium]|jgi:lysozyme|nr:glycoside hydrolase [Lachnospiraceae bacterium]GFI16863.1 hypothetical protein IMSAGC009_02030 [Lachnospiraceae bacterium]